MNTEENGAPRRKLSLNRDKIASITIEERLQKVLANAGLGSRRSIEERIAAGEVRVNAQVAEVGTSLRSGDRVELDGKAFIAVATEPEEAQVLIYHKPDGEVTTHDDPEGRPTVFERLPRLKGARWVSIGRLDINTTGMLLCTTDGELANAMMHPSYEVEREYVCRVHGEITDEMLERLRAGVQLEDGPAKFDDLAVINIGESHSWFRVVLREGRNREVRRMWEAVGAQVSRLKRIRYGTVELPRGLRRGHFEILPPETYRQLRTAVGLSEAPQTLTLQPVIGVRRAVKQQNEFRPTGKSQGGWSAGADEARELRAFDFVREDAPRGGRPGKRRPAPGGGKRGRGPRAGGEAGNGAAMRTFNPGAGRGENARRTRGATGKPRRGASAGEGQALPYGFPSDHAYAKRFDDNVGNRASEGNTRRQPRGERNGNAFGQDSGRGGRAGAPGGGRGPGSNRAAGPGGRPGAGRGPGGGGRGPGDGARGPGGGGRGPGDGARGPGGGGRGPGGGARGPGGGSRGPGGNRGGPGGNRGPGGPGGRGGGRQRTRGS